MKRLWLHISRPVYPGLLCSTCLLFLCHSSACFILHLHQKIPLFDTVFDAAMSALLISMAYVIGSFDLDDQVAPRASPRSHQSTVVAATFN